MINEYVQDEFVLIGSQAITLSPPDYFANRHLIIFSNDSPVAFYLLGSLLFGSNDPKCKLSIVTTEQDRYYHLFSTWCHRRKNCKLYVSPDFDRLRETNEAGTQATVVFFNQSSADSGKGATEMLSSSLDLAKQIKAPFLLFSLIQEPCSLELPRCLVAENEFESLFAKAPPNCPGKTQIQLEKLCSQYRGEVDLRIIRCDGVFGPAVHNDGVLNIGDTIHEMHKTSTVSLNLADRQVVANTCYIRDAVAGLFHVLLKGSPGEVYHLSHNSLSIFYLKALLAEMSTAENIGLQIDHDQTPSTIPENILKLSAYKLRALGWSPLVPLREALQRTYKAELSQPWEPTELAVYQGKLKRIQELELVLLKEVDRICKMHHIQYFLVCGSALGAVRHRGFIPWDDDLDIGMLRQDYDKFRKIVPKELKPAYSFHSHISDKECHYIFDKIRLKGTELSTKYSYKHSNNQGLFIDIFVYDQTSANRCLQKAHIWLLSFLKRLIKYRWGIECSVEGKQNAFTRLKHTLVKLFPFSLYHWLHEAVLKIYRRKINAKYLIDGVGMNLTKGAFPVELMNELITIEFEGLPVSIPKNYDAYLTWVFGKDYLTPPVLSKRLGHNIMTIDLGGYLSE